MGLPFDVSLLFHVPWPVVGSLRDKSNGVVTCVKFVSEHSFNFLIDFACLMSLKEIMKVCSLEVNTIYKHPAP